MKGLIRTCYYAFVLSIPFETVLYFNKQNDGSHSGVSASRVLGVLLFALALVETRLCFRKIPAAFWLIAWYLAAFSLSQLWIPGEFDARFREAQLTLIQFGALFLISANLFADEEFRKRVLRVFGWGMVLVAVALILGAFGMDMSGEGRGSIQSENPNALAGLFALAALCMVGDPLVISSERRLPYALLALPAAAVLGAGIMTTGSRGALTALAAGIAGLAACGGKANRSVRAAVAVVVIGLFGVLVWREFENGTPMAVRLEKTVDRGDTAGRTGIYDAAWQMFVDRPMLGYGGVMNRVVLGTSLNYASGQTGSAERDTHNQFLAVLTEVGLVGGLPFIVAVFLALWLSWKYGRRTGESLPFALMCTNFAFSMSGTGYREKIYWIIFAVAVGAGASKEAAHEAAVTPSSSPLFEPT